MVTNFSAQRSFSKLKQIENRLRTSMTQGRLVNLATMSIEPDILREMDFTAIISDFIIIIIIIIFIRSWQTATNYKNKLIDQSINAFVQHSENEILPS